MLNSVCGVDLSLQLIRDAPIEISMRGFPAFQSGVKSDSCQWRFKVWEAGRSSVRIPVPFAQTLTVNILVRKACAQGHEIHTKGEATERSVSLVPQVVHSHGTPTETSWISYAGNRMNISHDSSADRI